MCTEPRVNLQSVAREAGVSVSTVSRVLRGERYIKRETQEAVVQAMERLNYRPSRIARSLKRGQDKTGILSLLLSDPRRRVSEPFFVEFLAGATDATAEAGYEILISTEFGRSEPRDALEHVLRSHLSDGVIYLGREADDQVIRAFRRYRMPLVNFDRPLGDEPCVFVGPDNEAGAKQAVTHLIHHGHNRIAYMGGPADSTASAERLAGYKAVMAEQGLEVPPEYVCSGLFTVQSGFDEMQQILAREPIPTALFAASDTMAAGAIAAIYEAGLRVPDDIAIVGFDDIALASLCNPPLTTIRQPIREMGYTAVHKLLALIEGESDVPSQVFPVELVVRRSCGCP